MIDGISGDSGFMMSLVGALDRISAISLSSQDRRIALQEAANLVQSAMGSQACTIALVDLKDKYLKQIACAGCNEDFAHYILGRQIKFGPSSSGTALDEDVITAGRTIVRYDLKKDGQGVARPDIAQRFGIHSLLACPLRSELRLIGYLNHFSSGPDPFTLAEEQRLDVFARHISITIERMENFANRHRLQRLNELMQGLAEARKVEELHGLILKAGLQLVGAPWGAISQLNLGTGELVITQHAGPDLEQQALQPGQGITNLALSKEQPQRADDIRAPKWTDIYARLWADTRSELAVPIVLSNASVRVGRRVDRASKPIGVLNLESPEIAAFTELDADFLSSLARYGAALLERLEADEKQSHLAPTQAVILGQKDWGDIIRAMMVAIRDTLGYDYVNISLVKPDLNRIKTEYIIGIPQDQIEDFKRMADHSLDSADIQAHIVRTREIEVPDLDDPRFDREIYDRFGHSQFLRVYMPMIAPSDNRVLGTVEAGYKRTEHRRHIYEQDVRILKAFIDYTARALEQRQAWVLEKIGHEFRTPVVGIRNNASFLQRRGAELGPQLAEHKFEDILADCEILLSQIARLEYILGKSSPPPKIERTLVFRDIIIKTIRQLAPLVTGQGFDFRRVEYKTDDMYKIEPIWIDKARMGQVFFNLLINAIKYADNDPSAFGIRIDVDEAGEFWIIKIQDWGIGVNPRYREQIFEDGFRTPEAISRNVTGSGLGLTIARQHMREIGGDLKLSKLYKPTEFQVLLPRILARAPREVRNDFARG